MLPNVLRTLINDDPRTHVLKVHDDAHRTKSGGWMYPEDAVHGVLYIVRHPFDVAVSLADHLALDLEQSVALMRNVDAIRHFYRQLPLSLPQHMGSWTGNIASWLGDTPYHVTPVRYEDIYARPRVEFDRLARAAGFAPSNSELERAVGGAEFDALRSEEATQGFRERPVTSSAFFRAGRPGAWKGRLDRALCDRIVEDHGPMMARLGYLPDGGIAPDPDFTLG
jgi:hypothetical protein